MIAQEYIDYDATAPPEAQTLPDAAAKQKEEDY